MYGASRERLKWKRIRLTPSDAFPCRRYYLGGFLPHGGAMVLLNYFRRAHLFIFHSDFDDDRQEVFDRVNVGNQEDLPKL